MSDIKDIKDKLAERVNKYDKHDIINPIDIKLCETVDEVLSIFTNIGTKKLHSLILDKVVESDFFSELFGDDVLAENRIYCNGSHTLFGEYRFIVFGDAKVDISNRSEVIAFNDVEVILRKKSCLYAFDRVRFNAKDESCVHTMDGSNVSGEFHAKSTGNIRHNRGDVKVFDNSYVICYDSTGVSYNGFSVGEIYNSIGVCINDESNCEITDSIARCGGNSRVTVKKHSTVELYEKCNCDACDNSHVISYSALKVMARDYSNVDIMSENTDFCESHNNSMVRIMERGVKLRAYDYSIVMDFSDIYTNAFDYSIIVWMNKNKIFRTQKQYIAKVAIDYPEC